MGDQTKLWCLQNLNLFSALEVETMHFIAGSSKMASLSRGEYIYFPNDPSDKVYFLKEGRVKIGTYANDGRERIHTILNPGEIFGELAITGEKRRTDFAQALDKDIVVCAMSLGAMERVIGKHSSVGLKMTKLIGLRLRSAENRLNDLVFKDARTRIIDFVVEMANNTGINVGDEVLVKHKYTHDDISKLTSTSRQTVTTVLNELREEGKIYMERKKILIRNLSNLYEVSLKGNARTVA